MRRLVGQSKKKKTAKDTKGYQPDVLHIKIYIESLLPSGMSMKSAFGQIYHYPSKDQAYH
jgi:hypothetical protein